MNAFLFVGIEANCLVSREGFPVFLNGISEGVFCLYNAALCEAGSSRLGNSFSKAAYSAACYFFAPDRAPVSFWPISELELPVVSGMRSLLAEQKQGEITQQIPLSAFKEWLAEMPSVFEKLRI